MNIVEKLLKIDNGKIKNPTGIHKMYCKKIGQELEFEIQAIEPERSFEIKQGAVKMSSNKNSLNTEIDTFKLKTNTIIAGCKIFKDKELMDHFKVPVPVELVRKLLTEGEINALSDAITALSDVIDEEENREEIKN